MWQSAENPTGNVNIPLNLLSVVDLAAIVVRTLTTAEAWFFCIFRRRQAPVSHKSRMQAAVMLSNYGGGINSSGIVMYTRHAVCRA